MKENEKNEMETKRETKKEPIDTQITKRKRYFPMFTISYEKKKAK